MTKIVKLPLDKPPRAVRTFVRLVAAVDLSVSVERARVGQLLSADLARHRGLAAGVGGGEWIGVTCN